jgi:SnoaL-like domain
MRDTVTDYYQAVNDHDWNKLATVLADNVERIGIMSDIEDDISRGKEPYLAFVSKVIGSFYFHKMEIERIFYSEDRRFACAETTETIQQTPGSERLVLHCLKSIELDENELIVRINQFRKMSITATPHSITVSAVMGSSQ